MHIHFLYPYLLCKKPVFFILSCFFFLLPGSYLSASAQGPVITSFSPASVCQGDVVTITGSSFNGATAVKLGSLNAANFKVNDDNSITATVANLAQSGTVSVTTPGGTATTTDNLSILTAPIPGLIDIGGTDPFTNCDGNATYELKVRNNSSNITGNNTYRIDWGDNTAAFTQANWPVGSQISHTYTSQGYFDIKITITPDNGCTKTTTYRFYNGQNPLASFTTSTSTTGLCIPAAIEFQIGNWYNNSPGTTYQVDFGDGTPNVILTHPLNATNTVKLLSHTYTTTSCPASPDFTATLRASNGCFTTTYTLNQIIIRKKPEADFNILPLPACITSPVCFTNATISGFSGNNCVATGSFVWDFGDGTTSTLTNPPCHTYASPGTYQVTLTASNTTCGSDTKTKPVVVLATSPAPAVNPVSYCRGQAAAPLTAAGNGLLWYTSAAGGTGSSVAPTPSTLNAGSFTYYVSQLISGSCESPRVPLTVTVFAPPAAPAVSSPVQLCQNATAAPLTASGTGLLWYTSSSGGPGSATPPVPSTATVGNTTYYVSQTTNTCEGPRAPIVVSVNALAGPPAVTSPISYCQNQAAVPLTASGTGLLWYSAATGGIGSPVAPVPLTGAVGNTDYYVSQVTGCGEGPRATITVSINPRPSANIAYTPSVLCNVTNTPATPNLPVAVTQSGTPGGRYSVSPSAGLRIDAVTGEIDPSGALAGTYTIRYTIAAGGGCPEYVATTVITVNGSPAAVISYPGICTSGGTVPVIITGSPGGVYSSTAGLAINASTGAIAPAASTPGTYTVTYTIAPSAPCPGYIATTSITVTLAPSASISYSPADLCNTINTPATPNLPIPVSQTGTPGGRYSVAPVTGLRVDATTGTIDPSGAAAGIYVVRYTVPGAGGCPDYSTTATITVRSAPTATIRYAGSPYCGGITAGQPVSFSGTAGGVYSSGPGLALQAANGEINPALSTPGVYTVTYTVAPSAPCPGYVATASVEIIESPVLTFPVSGQTICSGGRAVFQPSSTVANSVFSWSVAGTLPANVSGLSAGTASGPNPVISLSFTNTGTQSQSLTIRVVPVNPGTTSCAGAAYNLTLTVNPVPPAPVTAAASICMGAAPVTLSAGTLPGNTLKWYDNAQVLLSNAPVINTTVPASFRYYVSQTNSFGCESPRSQLAATVYPTPKIVQSASTNPTTCGIPSGTVLLDVLDLNNNGIPNLPVTVHYDKFQIAYTIAASTNAGGRITVPLTAGTYTGMYVVTNNGCTSQTIPDVFVLKDPNPPAQPVAGYNPPICSETALNLTAISATSTQAGPIDYVWVGPAFGTYADTVRNTVISFPSASMSDAGTYIVYAIQNNCISPTSDFQVVIKQSPSKPIISTRVPLCIGEDLVLQAYSSIPGNSSLDFLWKGPGRGFPVNLSNAGISKVRLEDAGIYTITVSSPLTGCSTSSDTLIQIGGFPVVRFAQDTLTLPTGYRLNLTPVIVNATDPGILPMKSYTWTPSQDLECGDALCASPVATVKNNVCYTVKATNFAGCSGTDAICVRVFCQNSQVFIPNAFTPRGSIPENTRLTVRATGIASVRSFRVFNRWGKIVFERNNFPPNSPGFGWDGTVNGKPADTGVYIYTVDVVCENGVPYSFKGNVTLL